MEAEQIDMTRQQPGETTVEYLTRRGFDLDSIEEPEEADPASPEDTEDIVDRLGRVTALMAQDSYAQLHPSLRDDIQPSTSYHDPVIGEETVVVNGITVRYTPQEQSEEDALEAEEMLDSAPYLNQSQTATEELIESAYPRPPEIEIALTDDEYHTVYREAFVYRNRMMAARTLVNLTDCTYAQATHYVNNMTGDRIYCGCTEVKLKFSQASKVVCLGCSKPKRDDNR